MAAVNVVPRELLVPPDAHSRGFSHDDAALVLDQWLRRLAAQDTGCRTVLGTLATAFLRCRGQHELGFSRLADYARERLGISGRELQSLATVVRRVGEPAIRDAFSRGILNWAQVRLLVGVATSESEGHWLALARGRTVRALEALVREAGATPETDDDDEPHVPFRLRCPRRLLSLWRDTVELARRMAGATLTQGQAAEAIAAEGLSARLPTGDVWPESLTSLPGPADPTETHCAFAPDLDWNAVREAIPDDVRQLGDGADELDAFALDTRMRAVLQAMHRIDWQMGRLLRVFLDRRLHRAMGFSSAARWLRERLGLSARKARALVAIERKTWEAPAFGDAYRGGGLSTARALAILPVVQESTATAWVARGREVTVRRLVDEVEWALAARDGYDPIAPPPLGAALELPERQMRARDDCEYPDAAVTFSAPVSVVALFRSAVLAFAAPGDAIWTGFERLLCHVRAEWEGQPRHRDPIFARDGWRCAVPACSARRALHDHHLLFRSRGGDNRHQNRITLCAWHHLRGIHGGRVRAWGEAPHDVTWEVGVRAGGPPLLRLHGKRYV